MVFWNTNTKLNHTIMLKKALSLITLLISLTIYSCKNTGNEPNSDTNTHNTSQPSAAVHTVDVKMDARSIIPPNRLNDGILETRASNMANFPGEITADGTPGTEQEINRTDEQTDVEDQQGVSDQDQPVNSSQNQMQEEGVVE